MRGTGILTTLLALALVGAGSVHAFPVPAGQNIYTYHTQWSAVDDFDPSVFRPIYFDTSGGSFDMYIFLRQFDVPVDVYLFLFFPALDPDNFYLVGEDRHIRNLNDGFEPWRKNFFEPFGGPVLRLLPDTGLGTGKYYTGLMVTPANNRDDYYFWITELGIVNIDDYIPLAQGNTWEQVLSVGAVPSNPRDFMGVELGIDSRITVEGKEFVSGAETWRIGSTLGFFGNLRHDETRGLTVHRTGMPVDAGAVELTFDAGLSFAPKTFVLGADYRFDTSAGVTAPAGSTVTVRSDSGGNNALVVGNNESFALSGTFTAGKTFAPDVPLRDDFLDKWEIPVLRTTIRLDQSLTLNGTQTSMALPIEYNWGLKRDWGWKSCFADFPGFGMVDDLRVKGSTSLYHINGVYGSRWGRIQGWMSNYQFAYANSECNDPTNEWAIMGSYKITPELDIPWTVSLSENGVSSGRFSAIPETGTGETDIDLRVACGKISIGDTWGFDLRYTYLDALEDEEIRLSGTLDVTAGQPREAITVSPETLTGNFNFSSSSCATGASWHDVLTFRIHYKHDWSIDGSGLPAYADFEPDSGTGDTDVRFRLNCVSVFPLQIDTSIWINGQNPDTGEPALNSPFEVDLKVPVR